MKAKKPSPPPMVKVAFAVDDDDASQGVELMWAQPVAKGRVRVENIPFFIYGVSAGDIVFAEERDGELVFAGISIRGGHSTYRLVRAEGIDDATFERSWGALASLGCTCERGLERIYAVDVPASAHGDALSAALAAGEEAGVWLVDEGDVDSLRAAVD